jgi:carbon monoxide dehydrogenase subunit G
MELRHQFSVPATVEQTWAAFNDVSSIAGCFPGATLDAVDGDRFDGSVKVKLGPISMQYKGSAEFVERDEAGGRLVIRARGKDRRGQGSADATVRAVLTGEARHTRVEVDTDLAITGKPAQFGRGVIQDVSEKLLGQFVDALSAQLAAVTVDAPPPRAEIDLVRTVLPTLVRRYAIPAGLVAAVLVVVLVVVLG